MIKTLEWTSDGVRFIDQTKLPTEEVYVTCRTYQAVVVAIRDMIVRGAPAIGVSAAFGVALAARRGEDVDAAATELSASRPTAVNLMWASLSPRVH